MSGRSGGGGGEGRGEGWPFTQAVVQRGAEWLRGTGSDADVVISSRVRLARNLRGLPFISKCSGQHRGAVIHLCRQAILGSATALVATGEGAGVSHQPGLAGEVAYIDLQQAAPLDRTLMVERHLISKEHAKGDDARGVAISLPDERLSVMINEEDHLRMQVLRSGLELGAAMEQIVGLDEWLEDEGGLRFAYSDRFGYLTACPTNVGTGIRVSVMLHLPALKLTGEIEKVRRAARDMSLAVRGYYGEGSEAAGEFYQVSNQTTLGKTEEQILAEFEGLIIPQVIQYERAARKLLVEKRRRILEDKVFRALGALRYARLLTPEEALTLLSDVRLGVLTGLIGDVTEQTVNQLLLLTQPAHLQRVLGKEMDQGQRRDARADYVRERMKSK